jgi:hypothetical protein
MGSVWIRKSQKSQSPIPLSEFPRQLRLGVVQPPAGGAGPPNVGMFLPMLGTASAGEVGAQQKQLHLFPHAGRQALDGFGVKHAILEP